MRNLRVGRLTGLVACLAACSACSDSDDGPDRYRVSIRQTSYGIPHVLADDMPSAAAGLGYVGARDYGCILLDQIVRVRSERSKFFGPGTDDANITSDFAMLGLGITEAGARGLAEQSREFKAILDGYAAGFNEYVSEHELAADCAGKPWVRPVTPEDLFSYYYWLAQLASGEPLLDGIGTAVPPTAAAQTQGLAGRSLPDFSTGKLGSNGWAIGRERSASGNGMLLANPHFPWIGNLKFYESQITVPGELNAYGASLLGVPVINIGFNEHVAWTHTVTTARHFTLYRLELVPGDPTSYLYDGQPRRMEAQTHSIEVLDEGGATRTVTRTLYRTHYGPMVNIPALGGWSTTAALTFRNANEDNFGLGEQWLRMDRAQSLDELKQINETVQGIPWVNTMAVDRAGTALYMDASRTPNLSDAALARLREALDKDIITQLVDAQGATLLDGSDSLFEWQEAGAPGPGTVPFSRSPQLERSDFVFNANDSYWLTNPAAPLTGYSLLFGTERTPISPRTRTNLVMLTEQSEGGASGADGRFTLDELSAVLYNGRATLAELLVDQVLERCEGATSVDVAGPCTVLAAWDRRLTTSSAGAVLFRELLASFFDATSDKGTLFGDAFDPERPLETPAVLAARPQTGEDPILVALARASQVLEAAGFDPATPLGEAQRSKKNEQTFAIPGGTFLEGTFNIVEYNGPGGTLLPEFERGEVLSPVTGLTREGYWVTFGSSFVLALEYTDAGPKAQAVLTYSESSDPASPHYADQTRLFSESKFRPVVFSEQEIASDPELEVMELEIAK